MSQQALTTAILSVLTKEQIEGPQAVVMASKIIEWWDEHASTFDDLLELVEAVEFFHHVSNDSGNAMCPWCVEYIDHGHHDDCPRQAVIARVRG